jgi:hypothetical protein
MENNKPTAVDFIYEQLKKYVRYDNRDAVETFDRIFEQAKEIEKDIIINSHIEGQPLYSCQREKAEQYYNETYKDK